MSKTGVQIASVVGIVMVLVVGFYAFNSFSSSRKMQQIEDSVSSIHFSSSVEKRQCAGGGIDTSEWCSYTVGAPLATVVNDLRTAGFTAVSQGTQNVIMTGGDPAMTISLTTSGATTLLEAKILEDGRTI